MAKKRNTRNSESTSANNSVADHEVKDKKSKKSTYYTWT